jgi:hypothetical protein
MRPGSRSNFFISQQYLSLTALRHHTFRLSYFSDLGIDCGHAQTLSLVSFARNSPVLAVRLQTLARN